MLWCWTPPHCTTRDPVYIPKIPLTRGTANIPYHAPQEIGSLLALIRAECKVACGSWCWTPPHCTTRDPVYIPTTPLTCGTTNIPYHAPQEIGSLLALIRAECKVACGSVNNVSSGVGRHRTARHAILCISLQYLLHAGQPTSHIMLHKRLDPARSDKGRMQGGVWLSE
ncbi:hypothetical protein J6590_062621 [Homalodisca vitripennis]|nr:hypothetical protein J6590_062621 [Homalodisca vitripennis]